MSGRKTVEMIAANAAHCHPFIHRSLGGEVPYCTITTPEASCGMAAAVADAAQTTSNQTTKVGPGDNTCSSLPVYLRVPAQPAVTETLVAQGMGANNRVSPLKGQVHKDSATSHFRPTVT
ncbi:hypothetical protein BaRGS_00002342 [Batillaria attramentaria]|uniref:Uncharacterized protein n=1 Tax=Batillaria attramentaria TaxID=370345 RepID=A0ABD0M373_9CAEN